MMDPRTESDPRLDAIPFRLVFDHASDAIVSIDLSSERIVAANPRLEVLCGFGVVDMVGARAAMLSPDHGDDGSVFGPAVYGSVGLHEDVRVRRADGYSVWATVTVGHVSHEACNFAICIVRDETERRSLERDLIEKHLALRSAHGELSARVAQLGALSDALERRNRELTEISARMATVSKRAMLGELAAEVAHSMNNPLAALQSTLRTCGRVLARSHDETLKAEIAPLHKRCTDASARLARSVEGLRAACRSGSAAPAPREVVVAVEIRAVLALFAHRIGEGIRVEIAGDTEATAWSSADDIHHVFATLFENGLHAVGERGAVGIRIERQADCTVVLVDDSGTGIPEGALPHVFEPFFTTKPPGEGTGLGLSMARRVVTRLGGSISAQAHGRLGGASVAVRLRTRETA